MALIMNKLDSIRKVIHNKYVCNDNFLEERKPDFKMKINLSDENTEDNLIYRFDPDKETIFPFFSDEKHLCKICDYFIFFERKNRVYVLISELKRGSSKNNGLANKQLEAGEEFVRFIIKSANRIDLEIDENDCVFYKLRFSEANIERFKKRETKPKDQLHGCGGNIYEYRSNDLKFIDFK